MVKISLNKIIAYIEKEWLSLFKRKVSFTYSYILVPSFIILTIYFTNAYVRDVFYYNIIIKYGLFILIASLLSNSFYCVFRFWERFSTENIGYELTYMQLEDYILYFMLFSLSSTILFNFIMGLYGILFLGLPMETLISIQIFSIALVPLTFGISFILGSIALILKGDAIHIGRIINRVIRTLTPVYFALYIVKETIGNLIYLFPYVIFIEELRKFLLGLEISNDFHIAFIVSLVYLFIGYILLKRTLNYVKRTGKIKLY